MQLCPDLRVPIMSGPNVALPLGRREHYRLALYKEIGQTRRSVLVVSLNVRFHFVHGWRSDGRPEWSSEEKAEFTSKARTAIERAWDNKFRITTTSASPPAAFRDVGVTFDLRMWIDGWQTDEDFHIRVRKVNAANPETGVYQLIPRGRFDSKDDDPSGSFINFNQIGVVHEFGHFLGLDHEYVSDSHWVDDRTSAMNAENVVQPRHYVPFASWLTKYGTGTWGSRSAPVAYKVEGYWDESNAYLKRPFKIRL